MNQTFTIFGSTGDLAYRKLLPALYNMLVLEQLPSNFRIVAIGRRNYSREQYIETIKSGIESFARLSFNEENFNQFTSHVDYFQMDIQNIQEYQRLNQYYELHHCNNHLFYLALSPDFFREVSEGLKQIAHADQSKIIIEKPFGKDLEDAKHLFEELKDHFKEENIYHIDHYLGKEMIQNIETIRFKNILFANSFNAQTIDNIQITAFEKEGILKRGAYYEKSGALKDMVQNHLLQILSILAMEENLEQHQGQLEVFKQLMPLKSEDVVLGQYIGYTEEKDVASNSQMETYAALKVCIDNERWKGVPFYIRTGKNLSRREIQVVVEFKQRNNAPANLLLIKIQPTEGVYFQFNIKKPGSKDDIQSASMDFCQSCLEINRINTPEAYERLIRSVMNSERDYFASWEEIETGTRYIENLVKPAIVYYEPQSEGPVEADQLLEKNNHHWHEIHV